MRIPSEKRTKILKEYLKKLLISPMAGELLKGVRIEKDAIGEIFWELSEMQRVDLLHLLFKQLNLLYATGETHELDIQRIQTIFFPPTEL